jgi:hypothetical protein
VWPRVRGGFRRDRRSAVETEREGRGCSKAEVNCGGHGVPRNEAAFGTWQQAVRQSSSDTTSIQVDDLAVLPAYRVLSS